ncbi:uncharacterized protein METZ01_LOCUS33496, partial [marine metagenome]
VSLPHEPISTLKLIVQPAGVVGNGSGLTKVSGSVLGYD